MAWKGLQDLAKPAVEKDHTPPEFDFTFRRIMAYGWTIVNTILVAIVVWKMEDSHALKWLGISLVGANCFMALLYYAGASAVDIGKIVGAISEAREHMKPRRRSPYGEPYDGPGDDGPYDGGP